MLIQIELHVKVLRIGICHSGYTTQQRGSGVQLKATALLHWSCLCELHIIFNICLHLSMLDIPCLDGWMNSLSHLVLFFCFACPTPSVQELLHLGKLFKPANLQSTPLTGLVDSQTQDLRCILILPSSPTEYQTARDSSSSPATKMIQASLS